MLSFQSSAPAAPPTRFRVMPFGDSITQGAMSSDAAGYRSIVKPNALNARWVGTLARDLIPFLPHQAIPGDGMVNMAARIGAAMLISRPHVVVMMAGINDLGTVDTPTWLARHATLRAAVYATIPSCRLLVLSLLPQADPTSTDAMDPLLRAAVIAEAATNPVSHVDLYTSFRAYTDYSTELMADGTHPNDAGYAFISPAITAGIAAAIAAIPVVVP